MQPKVTYGATCFYITKNNYVFQQAGQFSSKASVILTTGKSNIFLSVLQEPLADYAGNCFQSLRTYLFMHKLHLFSSKTHFVVCFTLTKYVIMYIILSSFHIILFGLCVMYKSFVIFARVTEFQSGCTE